MGKEGRKGEDRKEGKKERNGRKLDMKGSRGKKEEKERGILKERKGGKEGKKLTKEKMGSWEKKKEGGTSLVSD